MFYKINKVYSFQLKNFKLLAHHVMNLITALLSMCHCSFFSSSSLASPELPAHLWIFPFLPSDGILMIWGQKGSLSGGRKGTECYTWGMLDTFNRSNFHTYLPEKSTCGCALWFWYFVIMYMWNIHVTWLLYVFGLYMRSTKLYVLW